MPHHYEHNYLNLGNSSEFMDGEDVNPYANFTEQELKDQYTKLQTEYDELLNPSFSSHIGRSAIEASKKGTDFYISGVSQSGSGEKLGSLDAYPTFKGAQAGDMITGRGVIRIDPTYTSDNKWAKEHTYKPTWWKEGSKYSQTNWDLTDELIQKAVLGTLTDEEAQAYNTTDKQGDIYFPHESKQDVYRNLLAVSGISADRFANEDGTAADYTDMGEMVHSGVVNKQMPAGYINSPGFVRETTNNTYIGRNPRGVKMFASDEGEWESFDRKDKSVDGYSQKRYNQFVVPAALIRREEGYANIGAGYCGDNMTCIGSASAMATLAGRDYRSTLEDAGYEGLPSSFKPYSRGQDMMISNLNYWGRGGRYDEETGLVSTGGREFGAVRDPYWRVTQVNNLDDFGTFEFDKDGNAIAGSWEWDDPDNPPIHAGDVQSAGSQHFQCLEWKTDERNGRRYCVDYADEPTPGKRGHEPGHSWIFSEMDGVSASKYGSRVKGKQTEEHTSGATYETSDNASNAFISSHYVGNAAYQTWEKEAMKKYYNSQGAITEAMQTIQDNLASRKKAQSDLYKHILKPTDTMLHDVRDGTNLPNLNNNIQFRNYAKGGKLKINRG